MKTLHFSASGEYTGYSINKSTWSEKLVEVAAGLALAGASAAVSYFIGNIAMPMAVQKYMEKQQAKANANTTNKSDEFEDPK
jgi:hypothetical protein